MRLPDQELELPCEELEGNPALLRECLGSPHGLGTLGTELWSRRVQPVRDAASLQAFLVDYRDRVLLPVELPAVRTAFFQTSRYEVRELIEVDQSLGSEPVLEPFAFASQAVGRSFLRRLRPLRDVKLLRRYEASVLRGESHGWHTLVYGAVLAVYSLPLRQGLVGYARHTLEGFLETGGMRLGMRYRDLDPIRDVVSAPLAGGVQHICQGELRCLPGPEGHDAPELR